MTGEELVREVAKQYGYPTLPADAIDSALWEHTTFPFGDEPTLREQLHVFFSGVDRGNP